jgi:hypothetical protein
MSRRIRLYYSAVVVVCFADSVLISFHCQNFFFPCFEINYLHSDKKHWAYLVQAVMEAF